MASAAAPSAAAGGAREFHFEWGGPGGPGGGEQAQGFRAEDIFADLFGGLGGGRRRNQPHQGRGFRLRHDGELRRGARKGGTRRLSLPDGREIDVRIPAGFKDGQQIRLRGQGGPGRNGGPSGDVLITVTVAAHPWLTRDGNNLKMDLPITLKEAVLGGSVTVPTLTGPVSLKVPAGSNTGLGAAAQGQGHRGQDAGRPLCPPRRDAARQARRRSQEIRRGLEGPLRPPRQDEIGTGRFYAAVPIIASKFRR